MPAVPRGYEIVALKGDYGRTPLALIRRTPPGALPAGFISVSALGRYSPNKESFFLKPSCRALWHLRLECLNMFSIFGGSDRLSLAVATRYPSRGLADSRGPVMQSGGVMLLHTLLFWFPCDSLSTASESRLRFVAPDPP